ncbi:hypothetical protein LTR56_019913 [Elasticomyces elasticus]|nr:hypothetical protein LTR56_019913 [Elasticomyces elasticus]KAK3643400.1 hypothetical protein LTR22_015703 [Elasticomyces elasticus]KAK4914028.1 hypothetical protein LTR49_017742 [Elasticomyces elasticus]KAK5755460.1 hypothetical protein LTS12_014445 [Elasticomyces elasticus]
MKTFATFVSALVAFAAADKCRLTAYALVNSGIDLGGFSIISQNGFVFQINDLKVHQITPNKGNGYPANYGCPGNTMLYGYAHFDDPNKKGVGMCLEDVKDFAFPFDGFNCRGLGGKKFQGTKGSSFFGIGSAKHAQCWYPWRTLALTVRCVAT